MTYHRGIDAECDVCGRIEVNYCIEGWLIVEIEEGDELDVCPNCSDTKRGKDILSLGDNIPTYLPVTT